MTVTETRLLSGEGDRLSEKQVLGALLRPWAAARAQGAAGRLLGDFGGLYLLGKAAPQEWRQLASLDQQRALALAALSAFAGVPMPDLSGHPAFTGITPRSVGKGRRSLAEEELRLVENLAADLPAEAKP